MYEFWYNYVESKYGEKAKLSFVDTESFQRVETSYYEL